MRFQVGDGRLHRLGRAEHEGKLHLARAEELADRAHPRQEHLVDDVEGRVPGPEGFVELGLEAIAVTVDDAALQTLFHRPTRTVLDRGVRRRALALKGRNKG